MTAGTVNGENDLAAIEHDTTAWLWELPTLVPVEMIPPTITAIVELM